MGVRKFYNKWRVYCHDKDGKRVQEYFDTEQLALDRLDDLTAGKNRRARNKKRSGCANPELPIGLHEFEYTKPHYKDNVYSAIKATVFINGKAKTMMRNFGGKRTRNEAIAICLKWRLAMVELIEKAGADVKTM